MTEEGDFAVRLLDIHRFFSAAANASTSCTG